MKQYSLTRWVGMLNGVGLLVGVRKLCIFKRTSLRRMETSCKPNRFHPQFKGTIICLHLVSCNQCDQIGQLIGLWATFQSLWKQLICSNLQHYQAIFVKMSKSLNFLVKSFLGNFYRHLAIFFWSHCLHTRIIKVSQVNINSQIH